MGSDEAFAEVKTEPLDAWQRAEASRIARAAARAAAGEPFEFAPYPNPVHVDPNKVDADIDALTTRGTRIAAEIFEMAAEAIRIRDERRASPNEAALRAELDALKNTYSLRIAQLSDEVGRLKGRELLAIGPETSAEPPSARPKRIAVVFCETCGAVPDGTHADWCVVPPSARSLEARVLGPLLAAERAADVPVPTPPLSLVHWARMTVGRFPESEHPSGAFEPLGGVTLGDLRAWVKTLDKASYIATVKADAADTKAVEDAGKDAPAGGVVTKVVQALRGESPVLESK